MWMAKRLTGKKTMIECYGQNVIRAQARANQLSRGPDAYTVIRHGGQVCVVRKALVENGTVQQDG